VTGAVGRLLDPMMTPPAVFELGVPLVLCRSAGPVGLAQAASVAAASSAMLRVITRRRRARVDVSGTGTSSVIGAAMSVTLKLDLKRVRRQTAFGTREGQIGRHRAGMAVARNVACCC
jgi:hypothetical protein